MSRHKITAGLKQKDRWECKRLLSQHIYGTLIIIITFSFIAFKIMLSCLLRSQCQIIVYYIYLSKKIVNDAVVQHSTDSSSAEAKAV